MATEQDQRPRYYEDQYLGADDLNDAVNFGRIQHARHLLGGHTWGISIGLELVQKAQPAGNGNWADMYITPGYAWDGYGRPIVVLAPVKIPESLFSEFKYDPNNSDHRDGKGQLIRIWLQYDERSLRIPTVGFESCDEGDHNARVQETFRIVVGERGKSEQRGSVIIDGMPIDPEQVLSRFDQISSSGPPSGTSLTARTLYDESVPHQEFPAAESENPLPIWLVPVGYVRWLPEQNGLGHFLLRDDKGPDAQNLSKRPDADVIREFRRYAGVVTEAIEGAGGVIRLRNRLQDSATSHFTPPRTKPVNGNLPENDLVWVEGDLRVVGDTRLAGGKLVFRTSVGEDEKVPLEIQRTVGLQGVQNSRALQVVLGPETNTNTRFAIGCIDIDLSKPFHQKFVVTSAGNVGIGTETPNGKLDVANLVRVGLDEGGSGARVITFARDAADEVNAGKIAYKPTWDNGALAIVGAGNPPHRKIHMWEDVIIQGNVGIGASSPMGKLTVEAAEHINVIFDRTDTQGHMTLTVGSAGTGIHFSDSNRFFISADPYANRNTTGFGNEVLTISGSGNVGMGTVAPSVRLDLADGGVFVRHPLGGGVAGRGLEVGSQGAAISALPNGRIGFPGYGIQHGQIRWIPVTGSLGRFELIDSSMNSPSGDYGVAPSLVGLRVARMGTNTFDPYSGYPTGWGGGVHTWDLYAEGSVGVGINGSLGCVMDRNGNLRINGTARKPGGGSWTNSCDQRLKKNIQPVNNALKRLLGLRGMTFEWKEPEQYGNLVGKQIGLLAQDVEKVFPDWVGTGPDGFKEVTIRGFEALTIEAMRELKKEIEELRSRKRRT